MPKRDLPKSSADLNGWAAKFFETIRGESDRGCVLVAAAFLDEALEILLRSRMSKNESDIKASINPLFEGIGPLGSFWAKTELCRSLQLIPDYEHEDLTRIRKLRNLFAHSYTNATFKDPAVVAIVAELKHFGTKTFPLTSKESGDPNAARHRFGMAAAWIAGRLHDGAGMKGA